MRQPVSIVLPTVEWTDACEEVAAQLGPDDELLVVHDEPTDPVASRKGDSPAGVRVITAGSPEGCSGKANAVVTGLRAARNDLFVLTDDDFHHPPDWLDGMVADYADHGPSSELPVFVGSDPLAVVLEPAFQLLGTVGVLAEQYPWGGAVVFSRDDLDESAYLTELSQAVSDDALLGEHIDVTAVSRTRRIPAGGDLRASIEHVVRYSQIFHYHLPVVSTVSFLLSGLLVAGSVAFPLLAGVITLCMCGLYAKLGIRRGSALFAVPALALTLPIRVYAFTRDTIVWGGRRYAYDGKFDVEVVE